MSELEDSTGWFTAVAPKDGNFGISMNPEQSHIRVTSPCCNAWMEQNDEDDDSELFCVLCRINWAAHPRREEWRVSSAWKLGGSRLNYSDEQCEETIKRFVSSLTGYSPDEISVDIVR